MPNYVKPDNMFLKTANKAEHCSVALTKDNQICGALTRVYKELPRNMGTVCYTAAINQQELLNAVQHRKTETKIGDNFLYNPMSGFAWSTFKRDGCPEFTKEMFNILCSMVPNCDMSMLNCRLPVLCVSYIAPPTLDKLELSYNKRPYNKENCIVLYGSLLYRQEREQEYRAKGIEDWSKDNNLIRYGRLHNWLPPYSYNSFNIIAHEDVYINFSEMMFRKEQRVIKDNPFIIYVDWNRLATSEVLYNYLQQGYNRCMRSLFSKPKMSLDATWELTKCLFFTREELFSIKPQIDAYNQAIIRGYCNG